MNFKEKIYYSLPIFLQNLAINWEGDRIVRRRYSNNFKLLFEESLNRDKQNSYDNEKFLIEKVKSALICAYNNTSYYNKLFSSLKFNPYEFSSLKQMEIFPIQSKSEIKANYSSIINPNIRKRDLFFAHTSGTTGSGLIFPLLKTAESHIWGTWWRYRFRLGLNFDNLCAVFGGRSIINVNRKIPPYWKSLKSAKQVLFSMYHLNGNTVKEYVKELNRQKVMWIHGYPSTIAYLAGLMKSRGIALNYQVSHITTGAENLLDYQKRLITEVFNVTPHQHYGLSEPVANISECEFGKLHIDEDFAFTELIPISGELNKYRLIGTSIMNDVFQFLRYDTKDIISLASNQICPCGRQGRIVESIDGRQEDYITLKDGTRLGRLDHIFKNIININEAQIFQNSQGEITFFVVKGANYTEKDELNLKNEIDFRLKYNNYQIIYKEKLNRTESGKLRLVISEFNSNIKCN